MIKSRFKIYLLFFFFFGINGFSKFWYQSPYGNASSGYRYYYVKILKKDACDTYYVYKVKYAYNASNLQTENGCSLLGGTSVSLTENDENHINDFDYIVGFDNSDEATPQDYCGAYRLDTALCNNHINFYCQSGDWGGFNINLALICNYEEIANMKLYPVPDLYADVIFQVYGVNCDNFKFVYSNGQTAKLVKKLVKSDDTTVILAWVVQLSGGGIYTSDDSAGGYSQVIIPDVYFMFVNPDYWNEASHCITADYYVIDIQSQNIMGSFWAIEKHIKDLTGKYLSSYYLVLNGVESFNLKFQDGIKCFDNQNDGGGDDGSNNTDGDDNNNPFEDNDNDNNNNDSDNNSSGSGQVQDYSYDEDSLNEAHNKVEEVFNKISDAVHSHFEGLYNLAKTLSQEKPVWELNFTSVNLSNQKFLDTEKFDNFVKTLRSLLKWVFSYMLLISTIKRLTPGD
ncbi:hypothetical protein [Caminibacter sp.]